MAVFTISDELAEQAARVPGLSGRVAQFIKREVIQHEQRQKRYRPESLALVANAQQRASERAAAGFDAEAVKGDFRRHLDGLILSEEQP